jgi:hypothetical protein
MTVLDVLQTAGCLVLGSGGWLLARAWLQARINRAAATAILLEQVVAEDHCREPRPIVTTALGAVVVE